MLQSLESGIFSDCTNLQILSLSANNISEISRAAFYGLAHLDLSNNKIVDFNPLVFDIFSISFFDPKLELLSMNVSSGLTG